ncbi:MAG: hypothetical protein R3F59_33030 [Myxococcota bacterium]
MDLTHNAWLVALVALLVANYVVTRTSLARERAWLFWLINTIDALVAVAVLMVGIPGVDGRPLVRVMVALVVLLHLSQNFQQRTKWGAEARAERLDAELRERQRLADEEEAHGADPPQ